MIRTDRAAEEAAPVEHPDLGNVARVVADGDALPDECGERRIHVAQALKVDPVPAHLA